jgi:hypothetical protein
MNDAVAYRRRVWFAVIVVTAFVLLGVAALVPDRTPSSLAIQPASADETVPQTVSADAPGPDPTAAAPTTTAAPAAETTSSAGPTTTSTTAAPKRASAPVTTTTTAAPKLAAPAPVPVTTPAPVVPPSAAAFLACVRQRESHNNYRAVSPGGTYRGAYQFAQSSWDLTARHAGRSDLVGVPPDQASPADQDAMALALYEWQGAAPWGGACS